MSEDSEDEDLRLSEHAAEALRIFCMEQAARQKDPVLLMHDDDQFLPEDWELSQFWYDAKTAKILAKAAIEVAGPDGRIACVSSPSVFCKVRVLEPNRSTVQLFEYDKRFELKFPEYFIFYDYNDPTNFPEELKNSFDIVVVDPPYLSEECLEKVSCTVKLLAKDRVVLCTGAVMETAAYRLLNVKPCNFVPTHAACLGNEFKCYANFDFDKYVELSET